MKEFEITQNLTVEVKATVKAQTEQQARDFFNEKICMTASFIDHNGEAEVYEDCIVDSDEMECEQIL